jgi:hypothetical protein
MTIALATLFSLNACTTVPHSSSAEDSAAKTFSTNPNMANLYVYRESALIGAAVGWDVALDGRALGLLTSGTYILHEVQSGQHTLSRLQIVKPIRLEAGRNYFVRSAPSLAASETKFLEVSEREGRGGNFKAFQALLLFIEPGLSQ